MRNYLNSVLCISLVLFGLVTAAPTKPQLEPRSFKVQRVATGRSRVKSHGDAIRKAYGKYGIALPAAFNPSKFSKNTLAGTNSSGETGEVTNNPTSGDVEFLAPVSFGGQTLMMDFDTGSSDTYVSLQYYPNDL